MLENARIKATSILLLLGESFAKWHSEEVSSFLLEFVSGTVILG